MSRWTNVKAGGVKFYTAEQPELDVQTRCAQMEIALDDSITVRSLRNDGLVARRDEPFPRESPVFRWFMNKIQQRAIEAGSDTTDKAQAVVLDGLNLLDSKERPLLETHRLVAALRRCCHVGILVYDSPEGDYGNIDFIADLVIELRGEATDFRPYYFLNKLSIVKSRFQPTALGWHQYKIGRKGVSIFPSIHFHVSRPQLMNKCRKDSLIPLAQFKSDERCRDLPQPRQQGEDEDLKTKDRITQMLTERNLRRGSCTVILGPRRSAKTLLTFDYLRAASRKGEGSLLVSLLDNQDTIIKQRTSLCDKICPEQCKNRDECYEKVFLLHFRPGCVAPDEFFDVLEERLRVGQGSDGKEHIKVERLVFWDLTQLEDRFPLLANEPLFLPLLMDHLKNAPFPGKDEKRLVTSLFMGAPNTELGRAASAMADNVLFCWPDNWLTEKWDKKGVAIYIDRIEGQPLERPLFFIDDESRLEPEPIDRLDLDYADSMIERIHEMQGLPMRKRRRQPQSGGSR